MMSFLMVLESARDIQTVVFGSELWETWLLLKMTGERDGANIYDKKKRSAFSDRRQQGGY